MLIKLVLLLFLVKASGAILVPPLNKGIIGKISKDFLQDFAEEVTDKTSTLLKVLSGFVSPVNEYK